MECYSRALCMYSMCAICLSRCRFTALTQGTRVFAQILFEERRREKNNLIGKVYKNTHAHLQLARIVGSPLLYDESLVPNETAFTQVPHMTATVG